MKKVGKYLLKAVLALFAALPLGVHYFNARWLGWLARVVFRYRVDVVMYNLRGSFPEKTEDEIKTLCKEFYRHFGDIVVEAVWFGGCRNARRLRKARIVEIADVKPLNRLYETAPSVVVMYSHCGNWELLGGMESYNYTDDPMCLSYENYCVVYKKMSSAVWDEVMRDNRFAPVRNREAFDGYVETNSLIRYVITNRDKKKLIHVNTDQHPYKAARGSVPVHFLNRDCTSMAAAAGLAAKYGFAVAYQRMRKDSHGHYTIEYVPICEDASKMEVQQIMQKFYDLLEVDIKANPANYLWTHKRFKKT